MTLAADIAECERQLVAWESELARLETDRDSWGPDPRPAGIFGALMRPDVCRESHTGPCGRNHVFLINRRTAFERDWRDVPIDTGRAEIERRQTVRAQIAALETNCESARRHLAALARELKLEVA